MDLQNNRQILRQGQITHLSQVHYIRTLKGMGFKSNARKIQIALEAIYPKGLEGRSDDIILRDLARYLTEGTIPDVQS